MSHRCRVILHTVESHIEIAKHQSMCECVSVCGGCEGGGGVWSLPLPQPPFPLWQTNLGPVAAHRFASRPSQVENARENVCLCVSGRGGGGRTPFSISLFQFGSTDLGATTRVAFIGTPVSMTKAHSGGLALFSPSPACSGAGLPASSE